MWTSPLLAVQCSYQATGAWKTVCSKVQCPTASTFVTQVVEEDSVQQVAIFGRVEEVNRGANHVHVFQEVPPVFRARRSDTARRLPSKFV